MAEKGRPPHTPRALKPWEFEKRRNLGTKKAKSDPGVWTAKGARGELSAREMVGRGVEISPGSRGGPHHSPFSETWFLSLWQEQSLGGVEEELGIILQRANAKEQIWGDGGV